MEQYYFIDKNGQQQGPVNVNDLPKYGVTGNTQVWKQGMNGWQTAGSLPELSGILPPTMAPPPYTGYQAPPPQPPPYAGSHADPFKKNELNDTFDKHQEQGIDVDASTGNASDNLIMAFLVILLFCNFSEYLLYQVFGWNPYSIFAVCLTILRLASFILPALAIKKKSLKITGIILSLVLMLYWTYNYIIEYQRFWAF